jgi:hypothetical protein
LYSKEEALLAGSMIVRQPPTDKPAGKSTGAALQREPERALLALTRDGTT